MRQIILKATTSSGAHNIRYDATSQSLYVDFPRGKYRYQNVQPEFVARLESAESEIGQIIKELWNKDLYPVEKL